MAYILFCLGLILLIYGYRKNLSEKKDFEFVYKDASANDDYKLVNHTIQEEDIKSDIIKLQKEIDDLKNLMGHTMRLAHGIEGRENDPKNNKNNVEKRNISYKELSQKLKDSDKNRTLEELSKEMEIGKGELLFLKNLLEK